MRALALSILICLSPAALAQPDKAPAQAAVKETFKVTHGPYAVTQSDLTIRDEARAKDLNLRIRTPKLKDGQKAPEAGWPLLVFSHGAGGSRNAFPGLQDLLASHGYICIAPTHSDSYSLKEKPSDARELATPQGRSKLLASVKLADRARDCSLILDRLADIAPGIPINMDQLAIAGHSAGAFTTQILAGVKVRGGAIGRSRGGAAVRMTSAPDDRFKAAVIISGQGTASRSLSDDSWNEIKVPILVFSGSLDGSPPQMGGETGQTRRHPFEKSRGTANGGPPAYLVYFEGGTHSAYSGKGSTLLGERPTTDADQIEQATNAAVLTFLNAHLRSDPKALDILKSDALARTIPGKVEYQSK
jgi:dienelactone hydrolase